MSVLSFECINFFVIKYSRCLIILGRVQTSNNLKSGLTFVETNRGYPYEHPLS